MTDRLTVGATEIDLALDERGRLFGMFSLSSDPIASRLMAEAGFDFVLVDLQHGTADMATMTSHMAAINAGGALPFVRVPDESPSAICHALDRGASAVIVPMIENARQAAAIVRYCCYPPAGTRSYGPIHVRGPVRDETVASAPCFAMIESAAAVEDVEAIAAVPGLAGIFVGPTDLAISFGLGPNYEFMDPEHHAAVCRVLDACRQNGILAAVQTASVEEAAHRLCQGFQLISLRSDFGVLKAEIRSARACLDQLR